jgi:hypothetical protein
LLSAFASPTFVGTKINGMKRNITTMLLLFSTSLLTQAQELQGVTFGFGAGFNKLNQDIYNYSLSTDTFHTLEIQKLSKTSFVISSVLSVKLGKLKTPTNSIKLLRAGEGENEPDFGERLAINIALNLLEINSDNISFNKNIDGGLGLGYFLNNYVQLAVFYDLVRIRQLRDNIQNAYLGKSIPNGNEVFNALDEKNNDLFYNKTFTGYSFKVIFRLGSKKPQ